MYTIQKHIHLIIQNTRVDQYTLLSSIWKSSSVNINIKLEFIRRNEICYYINTIYLNISIEFLHLL